MLGMKTLPDSSLLVVHDWLCTSASDLLCVDNTTRLRTIRKLHCLFQQHAHANQQRRRVSQLVDVSQDVPVLFAMLDKGQIEC